MKILSQSLEQSLSHPLSPRGRESSWGGRERLWNVNMNIKKITGSQEAEGENEERGETTNWRGDSRRFETGRRRAVSGCVGGSRG